MRVMEEGFIIARDLPAYKASGLSFNSFTGPWINPNLFYGKSGSSGWTRICTLLRYCTEGRHNVNTDMLELPLKHCIRTGNDCICTGRV